MSQCSLSGKHAIMVSQHSKKGLTSIWETIPTRESSNYLRKIIDNFDKKPSEELYQEIFKFFIKTDDLEIQESEILSWKTIPKLNQSFTKKDLEFWKDAWGKLKKKIN